MRAGRFPEDDPREQEARRQQLIRALVEIEQRDPTPKNPQVVEAKQPPKRWQ